MDVEELSAHCVPDGWPDDGHRVEDAEIEGGVLRPDVLVDVGDPEGVEGRSTSTVQQLSSHEYILVPVPSPLNKKVQSFIEAEEDILQLISWYRRWGVCC